MGDRTKIDWCDASWNPVTGCLHGCKYCYAARMACRFAGNVDTGSERIHEIEHQIYRDDGTVNPYPFGFDPTFHRYRLDEPKHWKKPRNIFVCSMADLMGEWLIKQGLEEERLIMKVREFASKPRIMALMPEVEIK